MLRSRKLIISSILERERESYTLLNKKKRGVIYDT